ncbi:MAG: hypothetical protein ACTSXQ_07370 [Alphaproteobacteria bacterium]
MWKKFKGLEFSENLSMQEGLLGEDINPIQSYLSVIPFHNLYLEGNGNNPLLRLSALNNQISELEDYRDTETLLAYRCQGEKERYNTYYCDINGKVEKVFLIQEKRLKYTDEILKGAQELGSINFFKDVIGTTEEIDNAKAWEIYYHGKPSGAACYTEEKEAIYKAFLKDVIHSDNLKKSKNSRMIIFSKMN